MKKILFFIPNLSVGGAEKVLVNLVNHLDRKKFDITVQVLFAGGINEQFLKEDIKIKSCFRKTFRANSQILKMFSPETLYKRFVKEHYDIVVSYLEGPTARIVSGCNDCDTKLVCWIHIQQEDKRTAAYAFRNYEEAKRCYNRFNRIVCVSEYVKQDFSRLFDYRKQINVLYNTNETDQILELACKETDYLLPKDAIKICVVGKLAIRKGVDKVARIQNRLIQNGYPTHIVFIGSGSEETSLKQYFHEQKIADTVTFTGYMTNPYPYIKNSDLFVCASLSEGFSTAATEALILGVPVCTVDVSGMREMLGDNNEFGIITENNEEALYNGIVHLLDHPDLLLHYKKQAQIRGKSFSTESTVKAVETMLTEV